ERTARSATRAAVKFQIAVVKPETVIGEVPVRIQRERPRSRRRVPNVAVVVERQVNVQAVPPRQMHDRNRIAVAAAPWVGRRERRFVHMAYVRTAHGTLIFDQRARGNRLLIGARVGIRLTRAVTVETLRTCQRYGEEQTGDCQLD